jgi:hypothetical protein
MPNSEITVSVRLGCGRVFKNKQTTIDLALWLMPVITATQKVEVGRIMVQRQPRQKASETPT